jgi:hypothetical protein
MRKKRKPAPAPDITPPEHIIRAKGGSVPVTMRALIARINRKLRPDDMTLKIARSRRARLDLGEFYVLNARLNAIVYHYKHCDPEELGRELGVLKKWEKVHEEI